MTIKLHDYVCQYCGKKFKSNALNRKNCSRSCTAKSIHFGNKIRPKTARQKQPTELEKVKMGCTGCLNITAIGTCAVIMHPDYILKKHGECFAKCDTQEELERRESAIENYIK